ncbi:MAG: EVE domain-containing protein [Myxococcales bacterium]|nr:EVE domain-containing protein [Myxococcales bacterium]MCB9576049.1 EVE domain-containing protein [Polyangiaceae bacterium]
MAHFLVKSEPYKYAFADLVRDRKTVWDGVRNFEARNNLRAMKKGDLVLYYHSNEGKEIVGVAKVVRTAYPDATATDGDWSVVDLAPVKALAEPVTLAQLKADPAFAEMALIKRSRISVVPVSAVHFKRVLKLSGTKL